LSGDIFIHHPSEGMGGWGLTSIGIWWAVPFAARSNVRPLFCSCLLSIILLAACHKKNQGETRKQKATNLCFQEAITEHAVQQGTKS